MHLLNRGSDPGEVISLLEQGLSEPGAEEHKAELVEALTLLADLHNHRRERERALAYLSRLEAVDLRGVSPDLVDSPLEYARELRAALESTSGRRREVPLG
jgi:hypothetical protein